MTRGRYLTKEHKEKIRLTTLANISCLGYRNTPETKVKISLGVKNSYTVELREVRRQAMLKRYSNPNEIELQSQRMKLAMNRPEVKTNISNGQKRRTKNPRHWANMHKVRKGFKSTDETKEKVRLATLGNSSHLGHKHPPEAIETMRRKRKEYWETTPNRDEHIGKIIASSHVKPNNCELELLRLFNEVAPNEWDYVGDGQFILAGKNPDLMCVNGKKQVAELFGDYYHRGEDPEERMNLFALYGYKTLIIWESELKEPEKVLNKIVEFTAK